MCPDIDECTEGSHSCDGNATCQDVDGSFECTCDLGFTGSGMLGDCAGMLWVSTEMGL